MLKHCTDNWFASPQVLLYFHRVHLSTSQGVPLLPKHYFLICKEIPAASILEVHSWHVAKKYGRVMHYFALSDTIVPAGCDGAHWIPSSRVLK